VRIDEQGVSTPPPIPFRRETLQAADVTAVPPIAAGAIEIRARVTLTSLLK
jgi:uncharacterized protein YggE